MAKFSVGRLEDGEGPSNRSPKKQRMDPQSEEQEPEDTNDYEILEEEEEEEEVDGNEDEEINGEADPVGSTTGSISVTLTDPDVFDCPICCEPFSSPVFQCDNGHTACLSCCSKLLNKCPSCCLPIGYNRCRAIEKVLESIKVRCQNAEYGCKEKISYSERHCHLKMCDYAPCSCPLSDCIFVGSSKQLYEHFGAKHEDSAVKFQFNREFHITLSLNDRFLILQERSGVLFILHNRNESLGNVISLSCIAPSWREGFFYNIQASPGGGFLKFQSNTKSIQNRVVDNPPSIGSLLVSSDSFGSFGKLKLYLCVRRKLFNNNYPIMQL